MVQNAQAQVQLSNGPEIKTLDFDKDSDENAQLLLLFQNLGTQGSNFYNNAFFDGSTNTGTVSWDFCREC